MAKKSKPYLPGDLSKIDEIAQIIRVNHAGEYGAKQIYAGQLMILGKDKCAPIIKKMADQEEEHLKYFSNQLNERKIRPSVFMPLWHVAGLALGAGSALLGKKAAFACTVAVEEVIDQHYRQQLKKLDASEADLKNAISKFRDEEIEHKDIAIENDAKLLPSYQIFTGVIKLASLLAIKVAKKF